MTGPYYTDSDTTLWHGDCVQVMRGMDDDSVHAVVTDPPYGLEFMGKEWDAPWKAATGIDDRVYAAEIRNGTRGPSGFEGKPRFAARNSSERAQVGVADNGRAFQSWCQLWATEALRVLRPGGHLLAFGGTRTFHRLTCAIEDAGFEIRDSILSISGGGDAQEAPGNLLAWIYGSGFP